MELVPLPSSLTFLSEVVTSSTCYSVCQREDGNLLVGTRNGLFIMDKDTKKLTASSFTFGQVTSVIERGHVTYVLHDTDDKWKVEMCLSDLQHPQTLFDFDCSCAWMSASDSHVVVGVRKLDWSYSYIIYDIITKQTKTTQVTERFIPYFLPDGHLLACIGDKLKKYKIEDGELLPLWTCDGLVNLSDVCADSQGIIYGTTRSSSKLIYIISPTGRCVFN